MSIELLEIWNGSRGAILAILLLVAFAAGWGGASLLARARRASLVTLVDERSRALERALDQLEAAQADATLLAERSATLRTALDAERRHAAEKLKLLAEAREQLAAQFRALAGEVLDEKARSVGERHREQLGQLLEPLQQRLAEFRGRVDEVYEREGKDRAALAEQVRQLMTLNDRLSREAGDLARALKSQSKMQGAWGELVLERVLEAAGLRRGEEFEMQLSFTAEGGRRLQPDAVIRMPDDRVLVVDAKVSLLAWDGHVNAEDDAQRGQALRRHLDSMRAHLRGLAERGYERLHGARSPDFVVMFVPIESAFSAAVAHDQTLWQEAWQRNVLIVGPASLLFVVRTVAQLWRQSRQDRNAREIAERGAELYDRFTAFVGDVERIGDRLRQARESWDSAYSRLATGRGNLVRQAERLRELGVKPSKSLPAATIERSIAGDEHDDDTGGEPRDEPGGEPRGEAGSAEVRGVVDQLS